MVTLAIATGVVAAIIVAIFLWLVVTRRLPGWPPKDWRAFISLSFTIGGSIAASLFLVWLVIIVWQGDWSAAMERDRLRILSYVIFGTLAVILYDRISLGWAINRRSIRFTAPGGTSFEGTGGDDPGPPLPPPPTVAVAVGVTPSPPPASPPPAGPVDYHRFEDVEEPAAPGYDGGARPQG